RLRSRPSSNVVISSESAAGARSAPPRPCTARNAISDASDQARPQSNELTAKRASPPTKSRRRPSRSAKRPPSSRTPPNRIAYAEITHWRFVCENPRSDLIEGSATFTIATSRMTMNCAVTISARALHLRFVASVTKIVLRNRCRSQPYTTTTLGRATLFPMSVRNPEIPSTALPRFPEELVASTAFLLKRLGFTAKEKAMSAYESTGLNPYHHAILVALEEDTHETQGSIADALGYDRGQLVGLLDELEERGLIERRRDPNDRRRHLVQATVEGKRTLRKLRTLSRQIEDEFLAPLSEDERAQLHALLFRLAEKHLPHCARLTPTAR